MHQTIRSRMITLIALPTLVIYVVVLGLMMVALNRQARSDVEREMAGLAGNYAARFDGAFREAAAIATATARFLETEPELGETQIFTQLSANTLQNDAVYGAAMAFEPGTFKTGDTLFCPYVYRGADGLQTMDITRDVFDWYAEEKWQWWHVPRTTGAGVWTDPYFDEGAGNVLMVTYSAPFTRDDRFRGVTTVDIMLPTLQESIGRDIVEGLDYVILTADGEYVYSISTDRIMDRTVFEIAEELGRTDIDDVARQIVSGQSGIAMLDGWDQPVRQWVFYAPISSTGWAFVARLPEHEALAGIRQRFTVAAVALAATLAMIILCIWYVSGRIARPIELLRAKVIEIAGGDLDARVEGIESHDEIGELARSVNAMTADLRTHVDHLAAERSARGKIESDLDLAREIQRGLLPDQQPELPGFELAGWNQAADKTGGDYFDWLQLPDGRTILTLADVTGHGIGPALIVAVCRAYMRASTTTGEIQLTDALSRVNDLLYSDIPDGRFVTAAVAAIDPEHHRMTLLSAGQAPMLFYEAATQTVHNWDADVFPLGVLPGVDFPGARKIDMASGDVLVLTTDGFFEWANVEGEMFGTERLEDFLRQHHELPPERFIAELHEAVLTHAPGTEQADDLTAVVLKRI